MEARSNVLLTRQLRTSLPTTGPPKPSTAMKRIVSAILGVFTLLTAGGYACARIPQAGEVITRENASEASELLSPGNYELVKQGMSMKIAASGRLDWPPLYRVATEQYAAQVRLNERGELETYLAGLPFPFIDPNDPQAGTKILWNFSYGPQ